MDAVFARPENRTPGSVLRHNLGALTLASPGGQHGAEDTCFALPDVLDAPAYMCGASQDLGVFWRLTLQRPVGFTRASTPDFITPQDAQFGIHGGGVVHTADKENRLVSPPCGLSPTRGKRPRRDGFGCDDDAAPASQGGTEVGRPPRHGGTPFGLSQGGRPATVLAPPFQTSAAAARRAQVLALKRSMASPPSHRNTFLAPAAGEPAGGDRESEGQGSACSSRYRTDFHQVGPLGKGSFSSVFEVVSRLDGCHYAVKRSSRELHTPAQQRAALTEVQALAAAGHHPWLVRYHTAWMEADKLHIQLELCGASLRGRVQERLPLAAQDVAVLLDCVAGALAHLHARGIAHMDVKPDNIFTSPQPGDSTRCPWMGYKLGDLGTACAMRPPGGAAPAAGLGVSEGDCRYVPVEVLNGFHGALDRADVFALGATAYELARGEPLPADGDAYAALRNNDIPEVASLPQPLMQLLRRCMHTYPAQRLAAEGVCKALRELSTASPSEEAMPTAG